MPDHHLAQLNIARMRAPLDSPVMAEFVDNLDRVNAIADRSPGFVWRLQTEEGDATGLRPFGDDMLVNMSVWEDLESLRAFVFGADHLAIMRKRRNWFARMDEAYMVLWWIGKGRLPTVEEAAARLAHLRSYGPSEHAFTFRAAHPPPEEARTTPVRSFPDECPAC